MLGRLLRREDRFFELFERHAARIVETSRLLVQLLADYDDVAARQAGIDRVDLLEKEADKVVAEAVGLLRKALATPFDRETIHTLVQRMDDIIDLMQDVAESLMLYDIQTITPETRQLAELGMMCCERIAGAVGRLGDLEHGAAILALCTEIDRLESDADRVMRAAMSKLFRDEPDVRELIRHKAIYELLESITDRCEDVAKHIQALVLEHA